MKLKIIFFAILTAALMPFAVLAEDWKRAEGPLPNWVGCAFTSGDNAGGWYWKGPVTESGFFTSGEGLSEVEAIINGVEGIANYINEVNENEAAKLLERSSAGSDVLKNDDGASFEERMLTISDPSPFIRVADRYFSDDDYCYCLLFISSDDIKKILTSFGKSNSMLEVSWTRDGGAREVHEEIKFIKNEKY